MFSGNTRRIVVIKDIPSNIIEEAIFILKHEPGNGRVNRAVADILHKNKKKENDYLLKEAEMIISNYINDCKVEVKSATAENIKLNTPNNKFLTNTIINLALVGSIALLILVITRII